MFYYLKIPNIHVNFAEINANLIVIRVTFAKPGFTATLTNCLVIKAVSKLRQSKRFILDLKIKKDKSKHFFEKITNEIQNANLAIQNDSAKVHFSIQHNKDRILTIQKETLEIKQLASLKQSIRFSNNFSPIERDISDLRKNIYQNRAVYLQQLIMLPRQTKLKQTLVLLESNE